MRVLPTPSSGCGMSAVTGYSPTWSASPERVHSCPTLTLSAGYASRPGSHESKSPSFSRPEAPPSIALVHFPARSSWRMVLPTRGSCSVEGRTRPATVTRMPGRSAKRAAKPVAKLLRQSGAADDKTLFGIISLDEPPKADVLAWTPGREFQRHAFAILRKDQKTYEARVDLKSAKVRKGR